MNRGSAYLLEYEQGARIASMRPRFMNRGSAALRLIRIMSSALLQ